MLIVYSPADGDVELLDIGSVRVNEASIISRNMDTTWKQVKQRLAEDDPEAMRMVALLLKRRSQPSVRLEDFNPLVDELAVRLDKTEIKEWATEAVAAIDDGATPEQTLLVLRPIIDAAVDPEYARELILKLAAAPKDPAGGDEETEHPSGQTEESTPTGASTSGSSLTSSTSTATA